MHAVCLCIVKRGDPIAALILIKTTNMGTICTEELARLDELEEMPRVSSGFGSSENGKRKRHQHGGKPCEAEAKRETPRESDAQTTDEEESEDEETVFSVCDMVLEKQAH